MKAKAAGPRAGSLAGLGVTRAVVGATVGRNRNSKRRSQKGRKPHPKERTGNLGRNPVVTGSINPSKPLSAELSQGCYETLPRSSTRKIRKSTLPRLMACSIELWIRSVVPF